MLSKKENTKHSDLDFEYQERSVKAKPTKKVNPTTIALTSARPMKGNAPDVVLVPFDDDDEPPEGDGEPAPAEFEPVADPDDPDAELDELGVGVGTVESVVQVA